jgi:hypothetical protein
MVRADPFRFPARRFAAIDHAISDLGGHKIAARPAQKPL